MANVVNASDKHVLRVNGSDSMTVTSDGIVNTVVAGTNVSASGYYTRSVATGIVAGTTQDQTGATALTADINFVATAAASLDGVALPSAVAGRVVKVINAGGQSVQVWPATGDQIGSATVNGVDTGGAITALTGSRTYAAINTTNWWIAD